MNSTIFYTLLSVVIVSLVSLVGIGFLLLQKKTLNKTLLFLVSLSAGSLFGGAFLHLLPHIVEQEGFTLTISLSVIGGILSFFIIEKYIHWHHCHDSQCSHNHALGAMNLIGDGVHNFIDGLIIAASYLASVPVGIATTFAVIMHEVPQEVGDFGVLLYSGMSKMKALFWNFVSASLAILGAIVGLIIGSSSEHFAELMVPFAAGGFLYIAGSDLIPELHKKCGPKDTLLHLLALVLGVGLMLLVRFVH